MAWERKDRKKLLQSFYLHFKLIFSARKHIFRPWSTVPAVYAAESHLDFVDQEVGKVGLRTFGSVPNGIHHSPFINSHIIERFVGKFASADGRCLILDEADGNKVLLHFAGTGYSGQSYSIPSGVTSIAYQAFDYTAPKSIILPEGLLSIEPDAFSWCSYLESVTIPTTLTSIGTQAFKNCTKLKEVKLKPTM